MVTFEEPASIFNSSAPQVGAESQGKPLSLVKKTEQPQWNPILKPYLNVVADDKSIIKALYLTEPFSLTADLERPAIIHKLPLEPNAEGEEWSYQLSRLQ